MHAPHGTTNEINHIELRNILYCHKHSITFISNPKVACSTIKNSLLGGFDGNVHQEAEKTFLIRPNINNDFFCLTRNPYSRALACFKNKIGFGKELNPNAVWHPFCKRFNFNPKERPSFEDFLRALLKDENPESFDLHYRSQNLNLHYQNIRPAYTGRIEKFEELESYLDTHSIKIISRNTHQTGSLLSYKSEIGATESNLIKEIYAKDFEIYQYSRELSSDFIPDPLEQDQKISTQYISILKASRDDP